MLKYCDVTKSEYHAYQRMTTYEKLKRGRRITNIWYDYIQLRDKWLLICYYPLDCDVIRLIRQLLCTMELIRIKTIYKLPVRVKEIGQTGPSDGSNATLFNFL